MQSLAALPASKGCKPPVIKWNFSVFPFEIKM